VIVAHHAGEDLILLLAGSGAAGTVPLLLVVWRTRLGRLVDRMRRR
jgi:hypothetical protein